MTSFITRADLAADLSHLGLLPGDIVMVHAALSKIGRVLGGPDSIIGALCDVVGPDGTIAAYCDWDASYEELLDENGRVPDEPRELPSSRSDESLAGISGIWFHCSSA